MSGVLLRGPPVRGALMRLLVRAHSAVGKGGRSRTIKPQWTAVSLLRGAFGPE